jgi:hypothetical protein
MLPFERKASPSCMGRAIVVNGRISCFASLPSLPQRVGPRCASSRIKPSRQSLTDSMEREIMEKVLASDWSLPQ